MKASRIRETAGRAVFAAAAVVCVAAVVAVFVFLIGKSLPAYGKLGVWEFVTGEVWSPDRLDTYDAPLSGTYGVRTMIAGTLTATAGALLVGGVLGYFTAVFLAFYCPRRLRRPLSAAVSLLAGIPSVVYGFFGIVFLLPLLSHIAPNNGSGPLATALILGLMILPTVVSLCRVSMEAVPQAYYQGSVAMGATHSETVFRIVIPAARPGITAALILGVGRALGETMAVVMVAGNAPAYPEGLFGSFRVLTANIVMEMGYAGEVQEGALVATGVVLLAFVLLVNLLFGAVSGRAVRAAVAREGRGRAAKSRRRAAKRRAEASPAGAPAGTSSAITSSAGVPSAGVPFTGTFSAGASSAAASSAGISSAAASSAGMAAPASPAPRRRAGRRRAGELWQALPYRPVLPRLGHGAALTAGILTGGALLLVLGFIFAKGLPQLWQNPSLIWGKYEFGSHRITVLPAIVATLWAVALSLVIAVPVGVMAAVYLGEYAGRNSLPVRIIRTAIDILAGVPSIVYGLFGMIAFVPLLGGSGSILAGSLTVSMMLLPTVVRSTEESLRAVPDALRQGSLALGAGRLRTVLRVVLPSALPGILSAVVLSMGRVIGESAPFLYTMGSVIGPLPHGVLDGGATLAVALYQLSGEGWYMNEAYAAAVVLIVLVLGLNLLAEGCGARLERRLKGDCHAKKR